MERLDRCLGLHQRIQVMYVVDGYLAQLENEDGYPPLDYEGRGETVQEALINLNSILPESVGGFDLKKGMPCVPRIETKDS